MRLEQQGIAHNTDIRAQADELKAELLLVGIFRDQARQGSGAEGVLLDLRMRLFFNSLQDLIIELPAGRAVNAVGNRQLFPFGRFQIIFKMGIIGDKQLSSWMMA